MKSIGLADFQTMWTTGHTRYLEALERVGRSGWLVLGSEVAQFEEDLAKHWGIPHAVGVANGLDALEIAFRCEGMKPGDRVITTPLSAFATTLALLRVGAVPVFVDVDASGLLDLELAENAMQLDPKPRFIVPVHLFGHAMSVDALETFAKRHQLTVIEDCAQAIGAKSGSRPVGAASRVCATSFYPTKNLGAFGDAGALLTSETSIRDQARRLRDYGQSDKYVHDEVGMNSRLDELHAAMLRSVQLPALQAQTERRAQIAHRYLGAIKNAAVTMPPVPFQSVSVWHLFPLLVNEREAFRAHLKEHGVLTGLHYPKLIPDQVAMKSTEFHVVGHLTRAQHFAVAEVSIPLHPFMSDDDVTRVIDAVNSFGTNA